MPASRKTRAGIKAQNQASKQSWWVTSDAESVAPPKSKKTFGQRKRRGSKGHPQPLRIKIEHLHLLVSQLPNDHRDAVIEVLRTASLRTNDKEIALRTFEDPDFAVSSSPTIQIEPIVAGMGDVEIEELIAIAELGKGPPRNRQLVKASNKLKAELARERGRRNLRKKRQETGNPTENPNPGTRSSSEHSPS